MKNGFSATSSECRGSVNIGAGSLSTLDGGSLSSLGGKSLSALPPSVLDTVEVDSGDVLSRLLLTIGEMSFDLTDLSSSLSLTFCPMEWRNRGSKKP